MTEQYFWTLFIMLLLLPLTLSKPTERREKPSLTDRLCKPKGGCDWAEVKVSDYVLYSYRKQGLLHARQKCTRCGAIYFYTELLPI